jgi:hypothetical protein
MIDGFTLALYYAKFISFFQCLSWTFYELLIYESK